MQMLSLLIGYKCVRMLWDDIKKWGRSKLGTKGGAKDTWTRSKVQRTRADSGPGDEAKVPAETTQKQAEGKQGVWLTGCGWGWGDICLPLWPNDVWYLRVRLAGHEEQPSMVNHLCHFFKQQRKRAGGGEKDNRGERYEGEAERLWHREKRMERAILLNQAYL